MHRSSPSLVRPALAALYPRSSYILPSRTYRVIPAGPCAHSKVTHPSSDSARPRRHVLTVTSKLGPCTSLSKSNTKPFMPNPSINMIQTQLEQSSPEDTGEKTVTVIKQPITTEQNRTSTDTCVISNGIKPTPNPSAGEPPAVDIGNVIAVCVLIIACGIVTIIGVHILIYCPPLFFLLVAIGLLILIA